MTRVQATALVLVNWRGVFYERYHLDPNVTALEGVNGAGKTTVLIACYVALLPDMSRLRFTNVGEHGATGGDRGLWGRLGERGRPSYSVIELRVDGSQRILAGVLLERKAEPTIEPTPFIITDLDDSTRLQDLLLERGEMDAVPELSQLREHVARAGGVLQVFSTAKEYFAALFDRGITPLRLATDADRNKLNEMLRTSMTGGISRALTSELRDFLLKEESGLAHTLKRMRANLDACRRTRIEVDESRELEAEIAGIYESGEHMFAAAMYATRERAEELSRRLADAEAAAHDARVAEQRLGEQIELTRAERAEAEARVSEAHALATAAKELLDRLKQARVIDRRIQERQDELSRVNKARDKAVAARVGAEEQRQLRRREGRIRQDELEAAATGLADFQTGLEELHRRASEHRLACERLAEAGRLLPDDDVVVDNVEDTLAIVTDRYDESSAEFRRIEHTLTTFEQQRREFAEVCAALEAITGQDVPAGDAFVCAQRTMSELRALDAQAARGEVLKSEIRDARGLAEKQGLARQAAASLSTPELQLESADSVRLALEELDCTFDRLSVECHDAEDQATAAAKQVVELEQRQREVEHQQAEWHEVEMVLRTLEQRCGTELRSGVALQSLRGELFRARDDARDQLSKARATHESVVAELQQLQQSGGEFSEALLRARDAVGGELLATRFEDLKIAEAAETEALLGPLAEAVVVEDVRAAAESLSKLDDKPSTLWLLGGDAALPLDDRDRPIGTILGDDVLVPGSAGWRLTAVPPKPTLGRRARDRRIAELQDAESAAAEHVEHGEKRLRDTEETSRSTQRLLEKADVVERGDCQGELDRVTTLIDEARQRQKASRATVVEVQRRMESMRSRRESFRDLLPTSWLLDAEDQAERQQALQEELKASQGAGRRLRQITNDRVVVEARMDELRVPPPTEDAIEEMRERRVELATQRDRQMAAVIALRFVTDNRIALSWTDAERALKEKAGLEPALIAQLERAKRAAAEARDALDEAEGAYESALGSVQELDAKVHALAEALNLDTQEWDATGIVSATDEDVKDAERELVECVEAEARLKNHAQELGQEEVRLDERLTSARDQSARCESERVQAESAWQPEQRRWDALESMAAERGVLSSIMTRSYAEELTGRGSANLRTSAREAAARLRERLSHAKKSSDVQQAVNELLGAQELSGDACLQAWMEVREWLRRRIPSQIAEVTEPLEALERLRTHLAGLEERLSRQESELRGESKDVASNIEIHVRRAQRQMRRLNQDLHEVRFGSIDGVRLKLERVDRMDQILRALREGEAQSLLFQTDMPIEEALEELFRRYGGGGRTTGQRLLDYREYIEPKVEVRRQSSEEWEIANPMRMSTGEAIGVGAALMMVVLTAWERDANLLRAKRSYGTLRLLFLDEANRLSQDNLTVLFDLCQSLDLQLIIAAPEVAQAEGNTTYRLVRRVNERGAEEVIVTGRRLAVEAAV